MLNKGKLKRDGRRRFLYRLAALLGRTVAELESLSAKEFAEWIEFYHLEPWGWDADCYKAGIVAATIANVNLDPKKKRKPFEASDFIPGGHSREAKKIDGKLLKAQLQAAFAPFKGKDKQGNAVLSKNKPGRVRRARKGA